MTDRSGPNPPHRAVRLSRRVLAAYSAPAFSQSFLVGPAISVLQGIYAKHFGLGLDQIAVVIFVSRVFNAVTDPAIGYLSDSYRARHGSRKPWLLGGSVVALLACWFLYVPAGRVTTLSFLCWFLLADIGWSMTEVPYTAWMAELTEDYSERTRVASWRSVGKYLGLIAFFGLPLVVGRFLGTTEFTPETLRWSAIIAVVVLPATALIAIFVVPNGTAPGPPAANPFREAMHAVAGNRPLWRFVAMYAASGLANGMGWGLVFFYIDGYLKLGGKLAGLLVLSIPVAIVAAPVWGTLCRRFGKQQMWAVGCAAAGVMSLGYLVISPGHWAAVLLTATLLLLNASVVAEQVAAPAVLADIVDYGRWRFDADHGGTYFALFAMATKANIGAGAAIALAVSGAFGFDAKLATQTTGGICGLLFGFSALPAVLYLAAAVMIWRFPINRRRQRVIVRAIERRTSRVHRAGADVAPAMSLSEGS